MTIIPSTAKANLGRKNLFSILSAQLSISCTVGIIMCSGLRLTNASVTLLITRWADVDLQEYWSRKMSYTINCQIIANDKKLIHDIDCDWPGCTHDARIWNRYGSMVVSVPTLDYQRWGNTYNTCLRWGGGGHMVE